MNVEFDVNRLFKMNCKLCIQIVGPDQTMYGPRQTVYTVLPGDWDYDYYSLLFPIAAPS